MLNELINMAQDQLRGKLAGNDAFKDINEQNKTEVVGKSVLEAIKTQALSGKTGPFSEMLSGNNTSESHPAAQELLPYVTNNLASRLNITPDKARSLASAAIPVVMNMLNDQANAIKQGGTNPGTKLAGTLGDSGLGQIMRPGGASPDPNDIKSLVDRFLK
jgi:hypothetical protein